MSKTKFFELLSLSLRGNRASLLKWLDGANFNSTLIAEANATVSDWIDGGQSKKTTDLEKANAYMLRALIKCLHFSFPYTTSAPHEGWRETDLGIADMCQAALLKKPAGIFSDKHALGKAFRSSLMQCDVGEASAAVRGFLILIVCNKNIHKKDREESEQLLFSILFQYPLVILRTLIESQDGAGITLLKNQCISLCQSQETVQAHKKVAWILLAQCYQYGIERNVIEAKHCYVQAFSIKEKEPEDDALFLNPSVERMALLECAYGERLETLEADVCQFEKKAKKNPHYRGVARAARTFYNEIKEAGYTLFGIVDLLTHEDIDRFRRVYEKAAEEVKKTFFAQSNVFWDKKVPQFIKWILGVLSILACGIPAIMIEKKSEHGFSGTFFYKKPNMQEAQGRMEEHVRALCINHEYSVPLIPIKLLPVAQPL